MLHEQNEANNSGETYEARRDQLGHGDGSSSHLVSTQRPRLRDATSASGRFRIRSATLHLPTPALSIDAPRGVTTVVLWSSAVAAGLATLA